MIRTGLLCFMMCNVFSATLVWADDTALPVEDSAASTAPTAEMAEPISAEAPTNVEGGTRFRWGISGGAGYESVSNVSGPMFGLDARLGVQWNDLLAFYAQPHLSFGALSTSVGGVGVSGSTGTFAMSAMAEATLVDRFFIGLGGGYGLLNNPDGPMFHGRLGGYPLMSKDKHGVRRGLMLGMDFRTIFISGATGLLIMGSIGYEAF
jgi:hypothetical protein